MTPTPTDLAREVLSRQRTRYEGQQPREDEVLAQALLDAAERERGLREALRSARSSIRLVCNRDKINEWTMTALREAEREIDAALTPAPAENEGETR